MSVTGVREKINHAVSAVPSEIFLAVVVLLACTLSFGLGVLAGKSMQEETITVSETPLISETPSQHPELTASAATAVLTKEVPQQEPSMNAGGQYVASVKGTKYHLPWCAGAKAIKEENKIWFASKEEAEKAGYTPAGNCKGI